MSKLYLNARVKQIHAKPKIIKAIANARNFALFRLAVKYFLTNSSDKTGNLSLSLISSFLSSNEGSPLFNR